MKEYFTNFYKCVDFKGKTTRENFLLFCVIDGIFYIICLLLDIFIHSDWHIAGMTLGILGFLPNISICIRRLHDTGKSGWWTALPIVGLPLIVFSLYIKNFDFMSPFIIIEGIISLYLFFLLLHPSKKS